MLLYSLRAFSLQYYLYQEESDTILCKIEGTENLDKYQKAIKVKIREHLKISERSTLAIVCFESVWFKPVPIFFYVDVYHVVLLQGVDGALTSDEINARISQMFEVRQTLSEN